MGKRDILVFCVVVGGLLSYFLYLYLGGTPTPTGIFETDASELCTPITTTTLEKETIIIYMCKSLHSIGNMFVTMFILIAFLSASFILGVLTGKLPKGEKE